MGKHSSLETVLQQAHDNTGAKILSFQSSRGKLRHDMSIPASSSSSNSNTNDNANDNISEQQRQQQPKKTFWRHKEKERPKKKARVKKTRNSRSSLSLLDRVMARTLSQPSNFKPKGERMLP
mmetsp:Transcript_4101/g.5384  ORF Transcript_4101/g.5384 Transcript_4101/m.5384 type:complete len:122 (-) Transcript_4101:293-658(-)